MWAFSGIGIKAVVIVVIGRGATQLVFVVILGDAVGT